ncbi:ubiquinol-cytochrome c reductase iron-sulfur subunit [Opitutus terrae]|uniref:Rieske (2Fe-2S) domain protein n=1 Tax=Opitutus terrae (strain DSM 11246 / JCM 15787 / PB90-1) TaxID=452637 RepID=B1ZVF3_OPITP|nr:ubiquinol-cytochrome c reductase iron-sulfur subunit [Opitutus terrae]ACB76820.1 Rieske (2Fe-2S) domain protein [Opitutus terrae PB90-1]
MNEATPTPEPHGHPAAPPTRETVALLSRRKFLGRMSIALGVACAGMLGVPVVGFVVAPVFRKIAGGWRSVGGINDFTVGETVSVVFEDPSPLPWAGVTARAAAWLRRDADEAFTAFSAHCTHLGCPVRWMPGAKLFLCPCHGGVYYADGSVAAGPPPLPLFRYDVRVHEGEVQIKATAIPITTTL